MKVQAIKDKNDQMVAEDVKVSERFKEYFEELLNFEEERGNSVSNRGEEGNASARRFE